MHRVIHFLAFDWKASVQYDCYNDTVLSSYDFEWVFPLISPKIIILKHEIHIEIKADVFILLFQIQLLIVKILRYFNQTGSSPPIHTFGKILQKPFLLTVFACGYPCIDLEEIWMSQCAMEIGSFQTCYSLVNLVYFLCTHLAL